MICIAFICMEIKGKDISKKGKIFLKIDGK